MQKKSIFLACWLLSVGYSLLTEVVVYHKGLTVHCYLEQHHDPEELFASFSKTISKSEEHHPKCLFAYKKYSLKIENSFDIHPGTVSAASTILLRGLVPDSTISSSYHFAVYGTLFLKKSYINSVANLCSAIKEHHLPELKCYFIDVIKYPLIFTKGNIKIPFLEIVLPFVSYSTHDKFPNYAKFLQATNLTELKEEAPINNPYAQNDGLYACFINDKGLTVLTDRLLHPSLTLKTKPVPKPNVLKGSNIFQIPPLLKGIISKENANSTSNKMFIILFTLTKDCSSCENAIDHVRDLKAYATNKKIPFYFVDCETDASLCATLEVSGYPSLIAYFTYQTDEAKKCGISLPYLRSIPYHGHIHVDKLKEWFDDVEDRGIHYGAPHDFHERCNVHLVIENGAGSIGHIETDCMKLMCYQLSYIECFISSPQNNYVSSIRLMRKDGISSEIYNVNKSLSNTFTSDPDLHLFHTPEAVADVSCSDNPSECVNMLSEFIQSHSRLLLTELTPFLFHTPLSYDALFAELPVLVVLVEDEGISAISWIKEIAAKFYSKIAVAYVNISLYPMWTHGMTPTSDAALSGDAESWVNQFPRVLIFRLENHYKAAFLKISGDDLTIVHVKNFITNFLKFGDMEDCNGI